MDLVWGIYDIQTPETEYKFHPERQWRFDYAWPDKDKKVAVEIEGGIWRRTPWGNAAGAHSRPKNIIRDMEKSNAAQKLGWRVFRFTPQQLRKGIAQAYMKEVLK